MAGGGGGDARVDRRAFTPDNEQRDVRRHLPRSVLCDRSPFMGLESWLPAWKPERKMIPLRDKVESEGPRPVFLSFHSLSSFLSPFISCPSALFSRR